MHEGQFIVLADNRDVDFAKAGIGDAVRPGDRHLRRPAPGDRNRADRPVGVPIGDIVFKCPLAAERCLDRAAGQLEQRTVRRNSVLDLMLDGLAQLTVIRSSGRPPGDCRRADCRDRSHCRRGPRLRPAPATERRRRSSGARLALNSAGIDRSTENRWCCCGHS